MKNKTQFVCLGVMGLLLISFFACAKANDDQLLIGYYLFMEKAYQSAELDKAIEETGDFDEFIKQAREEYLSSNKITEQKLRELLNKNKNNPEIIKHQHQHESLHLEANKKRTEEMKKREEERFKIEMVGSKLLEAQGKTIAEIANAMSYERTKQFQSSLNDGQKKYIQAMFTIKRIGKAIDAQKQIGGEYPKIVKLTELNEYKNKYGFKATGEGTPLSEVPDKDPWGNEYLYKQTESGYWIGCAGSDGVFQGFDQAGLVPFQSGADIVFSNGKFSFAPRVLE